MRKRLIALMLMTLFAAGPNCDLAQAEGEYVSLKAGAFLPNGNGNAYGDLKDYDTGFNGEVAFGFSPVPYIAIEAATGFYRTERTYNYNNNAAMLATDTISGIPLTLTVKGVARTERVDLFAGAGAGYYFCILDQKTPNFSMSQHGNALGYHVSGGFDYKFTDQWSFGAEAKWFVTRPTFENINAIGQQVEWDMGGTLMNLTVKHLF